MSGAQRVPNGAEQPTQQETVSDLEQRRRELQAELQKVNSDIQRAVSQDSPPTYQAPRKTNPTTVLGIICIAMIPLALCLLISPFGGPLAGLGVGHSADGQRQLGNWLEASMYKVLIGLFLLICAPVVGFLTGVFAGSSSR